MNFELMFYRRSGGVFDEIRKKMEGQWRAEVGGGGGGGRGGGRGGGGGWGWVVGPVGGLGARWLGAWGWALGLLVAWSGLGWWGFRGSR